MEARIASSIFTGLKIFSACPLKIHARLIRCVNLGDLVEFSRWRKCMGNTI